MSKGQVTRMFNQARISRVVIVLMVMMLAASSLIIISPSTEAVENSISAPSLIWSDPDYYYAFPGACKAPNGDLVVAIRNGTTHALDNGHIDVIASSDDGETWSLRSSVSYAGLDLRDPEVFVAPDDTFWLGAAIYDYDAVGKKSLGIALYSSLDNGGTWAYVDSMDNITSGTPANFNAVAFSQIQVLGNHIYALGIGLTTSDSNGFSCIWRSDDNGSSWTYLAILNPSGNEGGLLYLGGTSFLAILRAESGIGTGIAFSNDLGMSWACPSYVTELKGIKWEDPHLYWFDSDTIMLIGRDNLGGSTAYMLSDDNGVSWNEYTIIQKYSESTSFDGGYVGVIPDAAGDGRILVLHYSDAPPCVRGHPDIWSSWISGSVAYNKPWAPTYYQWTGNGSDDNASTAENWDRNVDGVVTHNATPGAGACVILSASSKNITWGITEKVASVAVSVGYTGIISFSANDFNVGIGGYIQTGAATLNPSPSYKLNTDGNFIVGAGKINNGKLNIVLKESAVYYTNNAVNANAPLRFSVEGEVCNVHVIGISFTMKSYTISSGSTVYFGNNAIVEFGHPDSGAVYNNGTITGYPGSKIYYVLYTKNPLIPLVLGDIQGIPVIFQASASTTADRVITLGASVDVSTSILFESKHATRTLTVDPNGYDLTADQITIGTKTIINGSESNIQTKNWDSFNGTWIPGHGTVILCDGGTVTLAPGQTFYDLQVKDHLNFTQNVTISGELYAYDDWEGVVNIVENVTMYDRTGTVAFNSRASFNSNFGGSLNVVSAGDASLSVLNWDMHQIEHGDIAASWYTGSSNSIAYTINGLDENTSYVLYLDDVRVTALPKGESASFTASGAGNYTIEVNDPLSAPISMMAAIIPLIVIVSVIPMVMGLGKKLK